MSPLVRPPEHRLVRWPAAAGGDACARESAPGRRLAVGRFFADLWGTWKVGESRTRRSRRHRACSGRAALVAGIVFTVPGCIESTQSTAECEPADATRDAGFADGAYDAAAHVDLPAWVQIKGLPPVYALDSDLYPGLDVCSLSFTCPNGAEGYAVEAVVTEGWGLFDDSERPGWPIPRDPQESLGPPDSSCALRSERFQPLHFVTLGHEGTIVLRLARSDSAGAPPARLDLSECTLVIQVARGVSEPIAVSLCHEPNSGDCRFLAKIPAAAAPDGIEILVPPL
jgi:hypothetical protein